MITQINDYFLQGCGRCDRFATPDCSVRTWSVGLQALRKICLEAGLVETAKWGHPCYVHAGRNIAILGTLRRDFRLNFFNAALMRDPDGILETQGPNTRHPGMIRFLDDSRVADLAPVIRSYLKEAMGYAEDGLTPPKDDGDIALPAELIEALDADPELAKSFHGLTPGRRKSYVISLSSAKTSATRVSRIARFRTNILAGKGATER